MKKLIIFILLLIFFLIYKYLFNNICYFDNLIKDYLTYSENNFKKISPDKRWDIRIKVLENYEELKNNYNLINIKKLNYNETKNNKIFVSIASFRDPECNHTINSLITKAFNKNNLRIVVCEQNMLNDKSALIGNENYTNLIHIIKLHADEAKGPTYARFLIQQLYNNEEYYLQIDSHTLFEQNWDQKLISSLNLLDNKSCITQYLPEYSIKSKNKKSYSVRDGLKVIKISALDGFTRINSNFIENIDYSKDLNEANAWSACFSFSKGNICLDAPIDPYTPELFFGEEMDITLRLYTRNWKFYSPNYPIAYTNFNRNYRNTFWNKKTYNKKLSLLSKLRLSYRLNILPNNYKILIKEKYPMLINDIDKYSLGNIKTLEDYEYLIEENFIPDE
jgi:hypothetical protein